MADEIRCKIDGCESGKLMARGWCNAHYLRWYRHGDPEAKVNPGGYVPIARRFWARVDKSDPDGCWLWMGHLAPTGYGLVGGERNGRAVLTHRLAYELSVGPIEDGLTIDHLCYRRACVNPAHLEAVTIQENIRRAFDRRKRLVATAGPEQTRDRHDG